MSDHQPLLSDYRADVERYFDTGSSQVISNRDRQHAAVLISTLFKKAEKEVLLFSQKLEKGFYDQPEVQAEILDAIKRGVRVQILVQEKPEADDLIKKITTKAIVKQCKPGSHVASMDINFTVTDGKSYRFETDREKGVAYACANDTMIAGSLADLFKSCSQHENLCNAAC